MGKGRIGKLRSYVDLLYGLHMKQIEKKNVNRGFRGELVKNAILSKDEIAAIDTFYIKHYGKKVPYDWHKLYKSYTGNFDAKYFPELLYSPFLDRKLNEYEFDYVLSDKNFLPLVINGAGVPGAAVPDALIKRTRGGAMLNSLDETIDLVEAVNIISQEDAVFFKPARLTNSGVGCRVISTRDDAVDIQFVIEDILKNYNNFVIQRLMVNSDELRELHPPSLNTIRFITYIWNGEVKFCPSILRIGNNGSCLDNAHAGGMFIGIDDSGRLLQTAITESGDKFDKHPITGITFNGYEIPGYNRAKEVVLQLHTHIHQVGLVNWDVAICNDGSTRIVEMNIRGGSVWLPQMAHGVGAFGEDTAEILEFLSRRD